MNKIALIEIMPQHSETLYSQILFLNQNNYEVTLFCNERIKDAVESFRGESPAYYYRSSRLSELVRMKSDIVKGGFESVILNTAQGSGAMKLMYMLPSRLKIFGTTHDASRLNSRDNQKLVKLLTQKLITRRINGYYVLAEYISNNFPIDKPHAWFNPAFFPSYEDVNLSEIKKSDIWVTIPGNLAYSRRDYNFVIDLARNSKLNKGVRFVLLGNKKSADGVAIVEKIINNGLEDRFIWFDDRVPENIFYAYIKHSDYFLTLIDTESHSQAYMKSKISGMFPLASAFNVKLLCEKKFEDVDGFNYPARYYSDTTSLIDILNDISGAKSDINKSLDFEHEARRYCSLIEMR